MDEVAKGPTVRERTAEVLDRYAIEGTHRGTPLEEKRERSLKEDVWLKRRSPWVDVLRGNGVWLCTLEDFNLLLDLLFVKL